MILDSISYGANEKEVEDALNDLPTLGEYGVSVTGIEINDGKSWQYNITFNADYGK